MRIAPIFLATSLATVLAGHLAMSGSVQAAAMDPRDVTVMLARAQAIDSRCKILSASESQDLRDLVAKAEIALASNYSVSVARQTLAKGRAAGKAAACDATASAEVHDILKAGVQATAQEPAAVKPEQTAAATLAPTPAPKVAAAPPVVALKAEPKVQKQVVAEKPLAPAVKRTKPGSKLTMASQTKTTTKLKTMKKVGLVGYSDLAEKYYVELKCRNLPLSRAQRMYEDVLARHKAALAKDGASAVRRMLKSAQSRAGSQSCA